MGIRERYDDAEFLFAAGRFEGALIQALIAVAATAKRKYPHGSDRSRFEQTMRDARSWQLSVEYRGDQVPIEHLLYKWVRCELDP